jgi:hypothetical protein
VNNDVRRQILLLGIIGAVGALVMAMCDLTLFGYPMSGLDFLRTDSGRGTMVFLPQWRLVVGSILGPAVAPLQIVGFWQVLQALRPAGKWRSWPMFLWQAHMLVMAGVVHVTFVFVGTALKMHHNLLNQGQNGLPQMIQEMYQYQDILYVIAGVELLIASAWFVVAVLSGKTAYPRWMSILNPFLLVACFTCLGTISPYPIGGYLLPAHFNTAFMIFMIVSTLVLLRRPSPAYGGCGTQRDGG